MSSQGRSQRPGNREAVADYERGEQGSEEQVRQRGEGVTRVSRVNQIRRAWRLWTKSS